MRSEYAKDSATFMIYLVERERKGKTEQQDPNENHVEHIVSSHEIARIWMKLYWCMTTTHRELHSKLFMRTANEAACFV